MARGNLHHTIGGYFMAKENGRLISGYGEYLCIAGTRFLSQNKDDNCRKNIRITFKFYVDIVH